jgi:hypothetical protein
MAEVMATREHCLAVLPEALRRSGGDVKCDEKPGRVPALLRTIGLSLERKEKKNS